MSWMSTVGLLGALLMPNLAVAGVVQGGGAELAPNWSRDGELQRVMHGSWDMNTKDAELAATRFLEGAGRGLMAGEELLLHSQRVSPLGTHLFYQQRVGGLPVLDGLVSVTVGDGGRVISAWASQNKAVAGNIAIAEGEALEIARGALGDFVSSPLPTSIRLGASAEGPTYRVEIPAIEPMGLWRVDISAVDGSVISGLSDQAFYRTGVGRAFYVSASVAVESNDLTDNRDRNSAIPEEAYVEVELLDIVEDGSLVGPYADLDTLNPRKWKPSSATGEFFYDRQDNEFEAVQAYWSLDYAQRYIQSLGFDDVNNRQLQVSVNVYPSDNSFYGAGTINMGSGGVDDGEDSEVIWHEMGHSIQDDQVPGWGAGHEARSMGEGFGDFVAASIGSRFSGGFQDGCVAEWDAISYSSTNPPCLRRVDGDKIYPDDLTGSSVHADGTIWSGALWKVRDVVGNDRALSIVLAAHFLMSPSATMNEAAEACLIAAENLGAAADELRRIENIFADTGLL